MKRARIIIAISAGLAVGVSVGVPVGIEIAQHQEPPATREITARTFPVRRIIDGDTFVIEYDGEPTSVRIAGIDTPERGEPGAEKATSALRGLIAGKTITLSFSDPQDKRDHFGRLLAVATLDGLDVGARLIGLGLAEQYGSEASNDR